MKLTPSRGDAQPHPRVAEYYRIPTMISSSGFQSLYEQTGLLSGPTL